MTKSIKKIIILNFILSFGCNKINYSNEMNRKKNNSKANQLLDINENEEKQNIKANSDNSNSFLLINQSNKNTPKKENKTINPEIEELNSIKVENITKSSKPSKNPNIKDKYINIKENRIINEQKEASDYISNNLQVKSDEGKKNKLILRERSILNAHTYFKIKEIDRISKVKRSHFSPEAWKELKNYKDDDKIRETEKISYRESKRKVLCKNKISKFQLKSCICCSVSLPLIGVISYFAKDLIKNAICEYDYEEHNAEINCFKDLIIFSAIVLVSLIIILCSCFTLCPKILFKRFIACILKKLCCNKTRTYDEQEVELEEIDNENKFIV
ncbi:MAG: hypothetical protein GY830_01010 [Bacteroidetes bacterium]|nr:hypothetical protein [Bacteroidota bacterium]